MPEEAPALRMVGLGRCSRLKLIRPHVMQQYRSIKRTILLAMYTTVQQDILRVQKVQNELFFFFSFPFGRDKVFRPLFAALWGSSVKQTAERFFVCVRVGRCRRQTLFSYGEIAIDLSTAPFVEPRKFGTHPGTSRSSGQVLQIEGGKSSTRETSALYVSAAALSMMIHPCALSILLVPYWLVYLLLPISGS